VNKMLSFGHNFNMRKKKRKKEEAEGNPSQVAFIALVRALLSFALLIIPFACVCVSLLSLFPFFAFFVSSLPSYYYTIKLHGG